MKPNATHPPSMIHIALVTIQHRLLKDKTPASDKTRRDVQLWATIRGMHMAIDRIPAEPLALCQLINYILEEA